MAELPDPFNPLERLKLTYLTAVAAEGNGITVDDADRTMTSLRTIRIMDRCIGLCLIGMMLPVHGELDEDVSFVLVTDEQKELIGRAFAHLDELHAKGNLL
jgi:hypothetical protein